MIEDVNLGSNKRAALEGFLLRIRERLSSQLKTVKLFGSEARGEATEESDARYRIDRALETLEEAKLLFNGEKYAGVINRIYYTMFYAIGALLNYRRLQFKQTFRCDKSF